MSFQKQLDDFNQKMDVPPWYLSTSTLQEEIIYSMHEKLRDDFEQETGSTMYNALVILGINPLISKRQIRRLVQLSRNNILAFLYFLLEGYYKTCRPKGGTAYSINEQLLMIAICKIDLLPTLRALDNLLPPPQQNPQHISRSSRATQAISKAQDQATTSSITAEASGKKPKQKSPYHQRLPKPVQRLSKLNSKVPEYVVEFYFWPRHGLPDYGEERDEPWFAQYSLNPAQRLIKKTLSETLDRYFKVASVGGGNKDDDEDKAKSRDPEDIMCLFHKEEVLANQMLNDELTVKARDRFLELIDTTQPYSRLRQKRIVAQLEHDIDLIMDRHRRAMHCDQTKVLTIAKADCVLCQEMLVSQPWPEPNDQVGRALVGEDCFMAHTAALDSYRGKRLEGGGGKPKSKDGKKKGKGKGKEQEKVEIPEPPEPPKEEPKEKEPKPPPRKLKNEPFRITKIDFKEELKKCVAPKILSECDVPPAPKKSAVSFAIALGKIQKKDHKCEMQKPMKKVKKKFFRAPRANKPYQFKYHRVFQSGQPRPFDLRRVVAKSCVKALLNKSDSEDQNAALDFPIALSEGQTADELPPPGDEPESQPPLPEPELLNDDIFGEEKTDRDSRDTLDRSSNGSRHSRVDHKAHIVEAVVRCANNIWEKQVAIKRAEMEYQERTAKRKALFFKADESYDPDNAEQMNKLLMDGFKLLRKDPRYVLASLPDSHKLPVLREWIKRRFGKTYSQRELEANLRESTRIFELVTMVQGYVPEFDMQGLEKQQNFDNYKQVKEKAAGVKVQFYDKLNELYMNTMAAAWSAMGNYMVPGGPPRRTFFAYIASNPQQIMRAKTWNGEFRNYRQLRDRRKEKERS